MFGCCLIDNEAGRHISTVYSLFKNFFAGAADERDRGAHLVADHGDPGGTFTGEDAPAHLRPAAVHADGGAARPGWRSPTGRPGWRPGSRPRSTSRHVDDRVRRVARCAAASPASDRSWAIIPWVPSAPGSRNHVTLTARARRTGAKLRNTRKPSGGRSELRRRWPPRRVGRPTPDRQRRRPARPAAAHCRPLRPGRPSPG